MRGQHLHTLNAKRWHSDWARSKCPDRTPPLTTSLRSLTSSLLDLPCRDHQPTKIGKAPVSLRFFATRPRFLKSTRRGKLSLLSVTQPVQLRPSSRPHPNSWRPSASHLLSRQSSDRYPVQNLDCWAQTA